jgi:hypothetical protein
VVIQAVLVGSKFYVEEEFTITVNPC